jgi:hypothetical protein
MTTPPPAMPPMPTQAPQPATKRRTGWIIAAGIAAVLVIVTAVFWMNGKSYDEMVKDCQNALTSTSTKTDRPEACEGLKQDDYDTILVSWTLKNAFHDMPKTDRDTLDYYDDGSINGSLD